MGLERPLITLIDGYIHGGWLRLRCDEKRSIKNICTIFCHPASLKLNRLINTNLEQQARAIYNYILSHNQCENGVLSKYCRYYYGKISERQHVQ